MAALCREIRKGVRVAGKDVMVGRSYAEERSGRETVQSWGRGGAILLLLLLDAVV